jgi:hypothetical protein
MNVLGLTYRQYIMKNLSIHSVAGLTKYAIREGLTPMKLSRRDHRHTIRKFEVEMT